MRALIQKISRQIWFIKKEKKLEENEKAISKEKKKVMVNDYLKGSLIN